MDLPRDFRDLLSALADSSAEYLVVGGWAVGFHAEPRFTKDIDLLIGDDDENLLRVARALETFGAPSDIVDKLRSLGRDEFLFFGVPPARVDVLRAIPGVAFAAAFGRKDTVDWDGVSAFVISREDLLASKRAAGRPKDLRDVEKIEKAIEKAGQSRR